MASKTSGINFNRASHVAAYKELFVKGKADLGNMTSIFQRQIHSKQGKNLTDKDRINLLKSEIILHVVIEAKKEYYKTNTWGRIAYATQMFFSKAFGIDTNIESAEKVLKGFEARINTISQKADTEDSLENALKKNSEEETDFDDSTFEEAFGPELDLGMNDHAGLEGAMNLLSKYPGYRKHVREALLRAQCSMVHHCAAKTSLIADGTTQNFPIANMTAVCEPNGSFYTYTVESKDQNEPSLIRIAKPNGDVLEIDITRKGKSRKRYAAHGAGRYVYKAMLYSNDKMPKEIAVMTSFPGEFGDNLQEMLSGRPTITADTNKGIRNEKSQLQKLDGIDGIINTQECMTLKIEGTDFVFACMDYYPLGNLEDFLNSEVGQNLSVKQKTHLITSLQKIVAEIHDRGFVHRDIKTTNIVIKHNSENELYEPVLIDFEKALSIKEDKRHFSATADYWPPEYAKAGVDNLEANRDFSDDTRAVSQDVPATSLDLWGLGLVCHRIWYKKDLITALGGRSGGPIPMLLDEQLKAFDEKKITQYFSTLEKEPAQKMIKSLLEVDPHKRAITLPIP